MFGYAWRRDPGADAAADLFVASPRRAPVGTAPRRTPAVVAAGREVPGHHPLYQWQAGFHRHGCIVDPACARYLAGENPRSGDRRNHQAGAAEKPGQGRGSNSWSIRPGASSSADRKATAGSPDAKSLSILMAARLRTAAARSPARTRPRSTVPRLMRRVTWRRTSWPRGLATKCQIQVSYAIGVAKPTSVMVTTFGTGKIADEKIAHLVQQHFDLRPKGIVAMLDLLRPIYEKTAGIRPLWPRRAGIYLGSAGQGRAPQIRSGDQEGGSLKKLGPSQGR